MHGVLGREARMFLNRLGDSIADMWKKSHSELEVMGWVRAKMSFAILRATNLCLHGSRRKWRRTLMMELGSLVTWTKLLNLSMIFFMFACVLFICITAFILFLIRHKFAWLKSDDWLKKPNNTM